MLCFFGTQAFRNQVYASGLSLCEKAYVSGLSLVDAAPRYDHSLV